MTNLTLRIRQMSVGGLLIGGVLVSLAGVVLAAPRQQSTNVEEGKCEVVSVGQYFCKIDGKCYYCDTGTNPDKNKNCYKETTCAAAVRPGIKGTVRPPLSKNGPILRRGVEGEQPTSSEKEGK